MSVKNVAMKLRGVLVLLALAFAPTFAMAGKWVADVSTGKWDDDHVVSNGRAYFFRDDGTMVDNDFLILDHAIREDSSGYAAYEHFNSISPPSYEGRLFGTSIAAHCYQGYLEATGYIGVMADSGVVRTGNDVCIPKPPPSCTLFVDINSGGYVSSSSPTGTYPCGTVFTLTATPNTGWYFTGWTGAIVSSDSTITFTLDRDMAVTANFAQQSDGRTGGCASTGCEQSESCPLILDLNSDGIHTTSLNDPVNFWIDLQGRQELTAWTDPRTEEAFLWMDLNEDHRAQVTELFGSRMVAPNGHYHANGFDALSKYDRPEFGGDGDGQITQKDWVWARLKLWVDRNHDAISQPTEISVPSSHGIVALNLAHVDGEEYDAQGNELYLVGSYVVRAQGNQTTTRMMADIEFQYVANP